MSCSPTPYSRRVRKIRKFQVADVQQWLRLCLQGGRVTLSLGSPYLSARVTLARGLSHLPCKRLARDNCTKKCETNAQTSNQNCLTPSKSTGSNSTMLGSSRKSFKVGRCVLIMNNKLTYFSQSKTKKTLNEWQSSIFNTPVRQLQKAWKIPYW